VSSTALDGLLEQLCNGDARAAEQVFLTYEPYLRKIVRRQLPDRLRTRFDSTDIVQSVWRDLVDGFRKAGWRFSNTAHLQAFLIKVTRNRFIDRCRQHSPALERQVRLGEVNAELLPSARESDPSQMAQAADLWQRLLTLCPPEHRELLELRRAGMPLPEIAAHTGLHVGSVRRVLRNLAVRLARENHG
jgi:RNA polymerase sigma-70 factor (ECF subfamily)